jgi:Mlc titration factor MtfA (ptsG expression regulator)
MKRLWRRWQQHREQRLVERHAIPEALWRSVVVQLPFVFRLGEADRAELRRLTSLFLAQKEFNGAGGLIVDDAMAVSIAVQACLPVLRLGLDGYKRFVGIVVHPDEVVARRSEIDDDGVVHEYDETLTGEAMEGGPVMLSWSDVDGAGETADWGYNVVIHEFAHVLDMGDGVADGIPPLATAQQRTQWATVLEREWQVFRDRIERGEETLLDPYGAEAPEEFFAVAAESFFVAPADLLAEHPDFYRLLAGYFRQDPAAG